ncbi:hypothetical protein [Phenylobacterium sp.]|uniref:hypothetical protein n=1 Tax=Phenylobacterium sp. TaxID=1871053 RepID=UPI0025FA155E|nr:hypothetical protein [Phenylobacterium sp.]
MTATADVPRAGPAWHFWLVGLLAVLWNGFGGYDYVMSMTGGDAYLRSAGMNDGQVAYFHAMPLWMVACWAIGVWGSVAGTLLLLARSKWAVHAFGLSLIGFLASQVYTHLLSEGGRLFGTQGAIMNGVICAGIVFFLWYSARMAKQGVLR